MDKSAALRLYLATRARRPRRAPDAEDAPDLAGQNGLAAEQRPDGPLVWVHSGQDAAARAARELARRLRLERDDLNFLFTSSAPDLPASDPPFWCQPVPDEALPAIRGFIDRWRPDVALWTEPDSRPALAFEVAKAGIPMFYADTESAQPDAKGWSLWPSATASLFSRFERLVAGREAAATLRRLGAPADRIELPGALREGPPALPCNRAERDALARLLSGRQTWLAAQVATEEIDTVVEAHRHTLRRTHRLLLILSPSQADTGPALQDRLRDQGFIVALRSDGAEPEPDTQIYIADSEGELGLWYRLAAVSFLGGTLTTSDSAADPMHAASLGSAILHGPGTSPHSAAYARLGQAGAARHIDTPDALAATLEAVLMPEAAAAMAHAGWELGTRGAEVTDRLVDLLLTALDDRGV